jgi:hypothetical protein
VARAAAADPIRSREKRDLRVTKRGFAARILPAVDDFTFRPPDLSLKKSLGASP